MFSCGGPGSFVMDFSIPGSLSYGQREALACAVNAQSCLNCYKLFFDVWLLYVLHLRYFGFIIKYEEVVCGKREWNRSGGKVYGKEQSVILRDREVEKNFWGGILWS